MNLESLFKNLLSSGIEFSDPETVQKVKVLNIFQLAVVFVAPLLGIFGTVIGIIMSFELLGASGIEHPQAVTAGIAQALITTASGLGIAILSVFPYNYFNSRVENAALAIEKYATSLEIVYEKLVQPPEESGEGIP